MHRTVASRRPSRQIPHSSPSQTLKQRRQNDTLSLASVIDRARRKASSSGSFRRWKAMRWADFGPTPGRRPSSSIRLWTGGAYTRRSAAEQPATEPAQVEPAHGLLGDGARLGHGVADGG